MDDVTVVSGSSREVRGRPSPSHPTGLFIVKNGLQGVQALSTRRREALVRAVAHGEADVPVRLPARVVTVDGVAVGASVTELQKHCGRVSSWGATGNAFPLTVKHLGVELTMSVRVLVSDAEDVWERRGGWLTAKFQSQFIAADPRKYGATAEFTSGQGVFHRGNIPAHPVVEFPSAPSAYTVTSPAGTFAVEGAVPGGVHRIDMRTGRVTRDGVWMQGVGRGPVWAVADGESWTHTLSAPGRVLITDTYI